MDWRDDQALQRRTELGERFLRHVEEGSGPSLVLIHGIPTWGYLWSGLLPVLARTHRVLVPELLGFGFSDTRDGFQRGIARQADVLDAWLERLGVRGAAIVGHDIGGGVAQHLAVRFPARMVDRPDEVARALLEFLAGVGPLHEAPPVAPAAD